jgi:hypothetical protein
MNQKIYKLLLAYIQSSLITVSNIDEIDSMSKILDTIDFTSNQLEDIALCVSNNVFTNKGTIFSFGVLCHPKLSCLISITNKQLDDAFLAHATNSNGFYIENLCKFAITKNNPINETILLKHATKSLNLLAPNVLAKLWNALENLSMKQEFLGHIQKKELNAKLLEGIVILQLKDPEFNVEMNFQLAKVLTLSISRKGLNYTSNGATRLLLKLNMCSCNFWFYFN